MARKKYAVVGTGGRSRMYINALAGDFKDAGELVALCDSNSSRMEFYNQILAENFDHTPLPCYPAWDFEKMIKEKQPDTVIVTTIDRTHHKYICLAMEMGCDVISEKPMTIDAEKCQQIIDTKKKTGKNLTVTFNYRYSPRNTKIKEIIKSGRIGDVLNVHFEWLLSTSHGADYFRRWHRDKRNSGGLMVHKSTHHFDLVNWWIDAFPRTVFAMGDLLFYGKENAENRGIKQFYSRARGSEKAAKDPFALHVDEKNDKNLMGLYYNAEKEDNYYRDQSVFSDGISIEDTHGVIVRYDNKAIMTYSLNACCAYEGYRATFNGTKGRLEMNIVERGVIPLKGEDFNTFGSYGEGEDIKNRTPEIILQPHWSNAEEIKYEISDKGGHGGGDTLLMNDIFYGVRDDSLGHAAGYIDGAKSILVGIAANESMKTGLPVDTASLVKF